MSSEFLTRLQALLQAEDPSYGDIVSGYIWTVVSLFDPDPLVETTHEPDCGTRLNGACRCAVLVRYARRGEAVTLNRFGRVVSRQPAPFARRSQAEQTDAFEDLDSVVRAQREREEGLSGDR